MQEDIERQDSLEEIEPEPDAESGEAPEASERLSQAARREQLEALKARAGENAQLDGDVIVIEAGEPVVLHIELDREGTYTLTWWATALHETGHHRWRDAAQQLLGDGESIHTSALGGGYLVEIVQTSTDSDQVLQLVQDNARVERVRELLSAFPEAVAQLPEEPVPDYLLPPEPEVPALDEAGTDEDGSDAPEEDELR
jgi:hypothetical protein